MVGMTGGSSSRKLIVGIAGCSSGKLILGIEWIASGGFVLSCCRGTTGRSLTSLFCSSRTISFLFSKLTIGLPGLSLTKVGRGRLGE
jgi:hypothetical protein